MSEFVRVKRGEETLMVHPTTVDAHVAAGYKVLSSSDEKAGKKKEKDKDPEKAPEE